jgi:nucleoside-diphosphate-sugar epimerase
MYGRPTGPMGEDTPLEPCSRKGEIRARLATELMDAHARGDVLATSGRASDYVGPGTHASAVFRPRFFRRLVRGRPVEVVGDPDQPHSYSYTPDVAAALAVLGTRDEALGRVWHLPTTWHGTTRELVARFAAAAGVEPRIRRMPRWALGAVGLVSPMVGEMIEILYQFEHPFVIDDRRYRTTFGVEPSSIDTLVATTLAAETRGTGASLRATAQE